MNTDTEETQQRASALADTAQDKAGNVADHAGDKAAAVKDSAASEVKDVTKEAKAHARDVGQTAQRQLKEQAAQQATAAGTGLKDVSAQMLQMAEGAEQQGLVTDLVGALGGQVERIAETLESGGLDEVIGEVKNFARRRPGLFLLGAAVAGFASSRIVKLSDVDPQRLVPDTDRITAEDSDQTADTTASRSEGTLSAGRDQIASEPSTPSPADQSQQPSFASGATAERPSTGGIR